MADKAFKTSSICYALHLFLQVVNFCFKCSLSPDFEKKIQEFKSNYLKLTVSIKPKVYAVFYHIPQFLKHHKTGLGTYSEQATEALHLNFKPHWQRFKRIISHPDYSKQLLSCVVDYNSKKF